MGTHTIIMDGFGGSITTAAISVAASRYVEVLIASRSHGTMSLFAPHPHINASRAFLKLRERQFRAAFDPRKTVEIAKAIVSKKIKAEHHSRLDELNNTIDVEFFACRDSGLRNARKAHGLCESRIWMHKAAIPIRHLSCRLCRRGLVHIKSLRR
jgi:CRISPR/Cas system-associated endonuclease Cas1